MHFDSDYVPGNSPLFPPSSKFHLMMSTVVSAELTGELAQILFNLTLEDNETRSACVSFLCVVIVDCIEGGGIIQVPRKVSTNVWNRCLTLSLPY